MNFAENPGYSELWNRECATAFKNSNMIVVYCSYEESGRKKNSIATNSREKEEIPNIVLHTLMEEHTCDQVRRVPQSEETSKHTYVHLMNYKLIPEIYVRDSPYFARSESGRYCEISAIPFVGDKGHVVCGM